MIKPHFKNIKNFIAKEIETADTSIKISVAWFNSNLLYSKLYDKLLQNVKIEIIINYDYINFGKQSLDFQKLIQLGAKIYFPKTEKGILIHNKFCLVDNKSLITGSYNWTYGAELNKENIIILKDEPVICQSFENEFQNLKKMCQGPILSYVKINAPRNEFEKQLAKIENRKNEFSVENLITKLDNGTIKAWHIKPGRKAVLWDDCITNSYIRFGEDRAMQKIWQTGNISQSNIEYIYSLVEPHSKPGYTNYFLNDVKIGDLFIACKGRKQIIGIGIVDSEAEWNPDFKEYRTVRRMKWLFNLKSNPINPKSLIAINTITHCWKEYAKDYLKQM